MILQLIFLAYVSGDEWSNDYYGGDDQIHQKCQCNNSTLEAVGESLCEGHGYTQAQCRQIGCCEAPNPRVSEWRGVVDDSCHFFYDSSFNNCNDLNDSKTVALEAAEIAGIAICVILTVVLLVGYFVKKGKAADNPLKPQGEASGL
jgi:hypothetical protein